MALQLGWILLYGRPGLIGLAAAADSDQAALIRDALLRLAQWNAEIFEPLEFQKEIVRNRETGSQLKIITSDVGSSYGVLPDFIICDELCHWAKPDLWYSLLSSAAKKRDCLLVVLTNAGVGRGWQWEIRELAQESDLWYFSSLDGPQAPWIREDWLNEQRIMLPDPVFRRLWLNQWQHSDGEFLTLAEVEACRDESLSPQQAGQPHCSYIAAIDYAEKHDLTVGVLIHWENSKLIVDRMDVRKPTPDHPTRVQWVDDWIANIAQNFHRVT
jgi:phage terminase large subunit-like protein